MTPLGYLAAAVLALLLGGIGVQTWRVHGLQTDLLHEQLARKTELAALAEAAASASEAARAEEQRRAAATQEAAHAAEKQVTQARADADAAADALRRGLQRAAAAAATAGAVQAGLSAAAAQPGTPAASADLVPADLLGRCGERVRQLALVADERGAAGSACQQSFDALRTP